MDGIFKSIQIVLLYLLISTSANAQDYGTYQTFDAKLLQLNDHISIESKLTRVVVSLSRNSSQLTVRTTIPFSSLNISPEDNSVIDPQGLAFSLSVNIDPMQIQDYLTSAKLFTTKAALTLNNTTKTALVEFMPFPAGTDLDGDFNVTILIQFKARDFGLDVTNSNSKFIIRINDARVNRV